MKKLACVLLAAVMALGVFAGCGEKKTDWEYIEDKGKMTMGITLYEPMNYYDESGKLTGFDTEFAEAVCEILGVEADFQVIEWEQKETELNAKSIDCIWNGLTIDDERKENMLFATPYVENKQVVIIKKDNADKYKDLAAMKGASVAVENGSAGMTVTEEEDVFVDSKVVKAAAQKDALLEVKAGTTELAILDYTLAKAVLTEDSDYNDLMMVDGVELGVEQYGIGFRLDDTELVDKVNEAIDQLVEDGTMDKLADKYGVNLAF